MIKKNFYTKRSYVLIYLAFLFICSVVLMSKIYNVETNNAVAEWIINYKGGFGRRGLLGEIFTLISLSTGIYLKKIVLYFLIILFFLYYALIYFLIRKIEPDFFFLIAIFSPLFLIFPLAELEALGRKDILIPIFFILFTLSYKYSNFTTLAICLLIFYIPLLLIHEVSIFYLPYFYSILFFKLQDINFKEILIISIVTTILSLIILTLVFSVHSTEDINKMCTYLFKNLKTKCGLGAYVLDRTLMDNISELRGIKFIDIIRGLWIIFLGYIGLIILVFKTTYKNKKFSLLSEKLQFYQLFIILFFFTIIPFFIAVDWGRWFNLSYSMSFLFYIFLYNNNYFNLHETSLTNKINLFINRRFIYVLTILLICFSWNPKSVYHEDIGSIPIYRLINKLFKY